MHASTDIRIVKCLDGLYYSFETLEYVYSLLYEVCSRIKDDQTSLIPALWRCWSFIDILHRIREIAKALPGLSNRRRELRVFLDATQSATEYRNYVQHLKAELLKKEINPFPVWGSLAWVDPKNPTTSYVVLFGTQVNGTSYSGCVFDTIERKWVSKVSLDIEGMSFNFDPIYEACMRFRDFIIPWALSTYKPGIQITTELPIISVQVIDQNGRKSSSSLQRTVDG